jgi:hypothetical protein
MLWQLFKGFYYYNMNMKTESHNLGLVESRYEKPMRTGHISKVRCSSTAFPKMFICRPRLAQPQPWKKKMQNSCFS